MSGDGSHGNASVYHMLKCFLPFIDVINDILIKVMGISGFKVGKQ
jgi:hypothetical protein